MLRGLGVQELVIIFLVVVLLFGPKKLAELGKGLGETIKEFKKVNKEADGAVKESNKKP